MKKTKLSFLAAKMFSFIFLASCEETYHLLRLFDYQLSLQPDAATASDCKNKIAVNLSLSNRLSFFFNNPVNRLIRLSAFNKSGKTQI